MVRMAGSQRGQAIPTQLSLAQFEAFVLPHLSRGSRGPTPKLGLHKIFNYILKLLYMGCQWKELPIEKDKEGRPEIHYTRIYGTFRRWQFDLLDVTVIHGDGTTTAAKKGGIPLSVCLVGRISSVACCFDSNASASRIMGS